METRELTAIFVQNVRRLLADGEHSQGDLSLALGTDAGTVSRMLSGRHSPSADTIARLATAFGVPAAELFRELSGPVAPTKRRLVPCAKR